MNCSQCNHQFCWMCMEPWSEHGNASGGYYKCNKYEEQKSKGDIDPDQVKRDQIKNDLNKYIHYYERFQNHEIANKYALKEMPKLENVVKRLNIEKNYPVSELSFILEASEEAIKCRKILSWTYVYGFYITDMKHKELFEDMQTQLEKNCEVMHSLIEKKDFTEFLREESIDKKDFYAYRSELTDRYKATRNFSRNIIDALEE